MSLFTAMLLPQPLPPLYCVLWKETTMQKLKKGEVYNQMDTSVSFGQRSFSLHGQRRLQTLSWSEY